MSTPFASKLFENPTNNIDGWDEWDWVDNNNATTATKEQAQYNQHPPQATYSPSTNVQAPVIDNHTMNHFSPVAQMPPPTLDQFSPPTQFAPMQPNNNHISNAYHQDVHAAQYQDASFVNNNNQSANNFVQPTIPNYHQPTNTLNFTQGQNHETVTPQSPPIPPRTPFSEPAVFEQPSFQNVTMESPMAVQSAHVQSPSFASPVESSTASVPVFSSSSTLPPVLPPPSLNQSPFANTNPFKKVGPHAHRTPPPPPVLAAAPAPVPEVFHQQPRPTHLQDNSESITHNDRNEYLQTGHLSGEGENSAMFAGVDTLAQYSSSEGNGDSLPPPGLSRLVLGEPETNEVNNSQPPPGLDRLVTGIEISQADINLDRQADGQDNAGTTVSQLIRSNSQFSSVQSQPTTPLQPVESPNYEIDSNEPILESDRNQYLVAGENVIDNTNVAATATIVPNTNIERVVTGLENVENQDLTLPTSSGYGCRDLDMDGENIEDQQQQQQQKQKQPQQKQPKQQQPQPPQQPIQQQAQNRFNANTQPPVDTVEDADKPSNHNQKNQSNLSSGNESEREKAYQSRKGPTSKRSDERRKKRDETRYDSDDTDHSIRERRRPKESERYEKERGYRGRSMDVDENDSRSYRDRSEKQYRGEKHHRPPSRDEEDRYERYRYTEGRSNRDNKYRYETDGSHYEKDDPRYERNRRRGDRDARDYGRYRGEDRYYKSKDFERESRDDRERYRGRDERYSDHDNVNKSRRERRPQKDRSGNGSERGDYPSGYYHQPMNPAFGYDPYTSFQQNRQYYENLRVTNPVAYAEWYNRYFSGQMSAANSAVASVSNDRIESGRESVHSGRSSSRDNDRSQQHLHSLETTQASMEPERLTPHKFTSTHSSVSYQNGLLVCVKQKYTPNDIQNNVHLVKFALNNQTKRLYQMYPGPLSSITHTKQVIDFCLEQVRNGPNAVGLNSRSTSNSMSSLQSVDNNVCRASFSLLWNFLILLLRQRGVFVGSDIAELLLKNRDEYPYEQQQLNSTKLSNAQRDSGEQSSDADSKDESNDAFSNESEQVTLSEKEITEKFRDFLLYGSINEALEWATDNNLWGHALFLASKMDRRSHANVMIKFANKLPLADPLQTLYQLKSGRVPLSVTSTQDEKWGDWRPHLAMIISNPSQSNAELDRKAIVTMGDTLHNRGDLFAAQFCYLMAKVEFSNYSEVKQDASIILNNTANAVRLILLGASCYKSTFNEFATDEAIIMTEIYEYACALANSQFSIVEFQPYKYLLGTRMLDYGFHLKSLLYMEQVASHIQRNSGQYERSFIEKVFNMADKLKYYDPVMEKNLDNLNDEDAAQSNNQLQWQQDLMNILGQNLAPVNNFENTIPLHSVDPYQQQPMSLPPINNTSSQIDQEFTQINQQFQDLSLQYQNASYEYGNTGVETMAGQTTDANVANTYADPIPPYAQPNPYDSHQQPEFYGHTQANESVGSTGYSEQQASYQQQAYNDPLAYGAPAYGSEAINHRTESNQSHFGPTAELQSPNDILSRLSEQEEDDDDGADDDDEEEVVDNVPKPMISMPSSFSSKPGFYDDADSTSAKPVKSQTSAESDKAEDAKKKPMPNGTNDGAKSGWIGGIFNKFSFKPKNQAHLPEDKNPSIIWDEQNKRWVNKDGDDNDKEAFKPPPKMGDFPAMAHTPDVATPNIPVAEPLNTTQPQNSPLPLPLPNSPDPNMANDSAAVSKVPSLQSNMFKMQRNKTLKKSYVDVFNPSGAAPKNDAPILAPMVPIMPSQANFFVPAAIPNNQQGQDELPAFYNPNQYGGYQQ